MIAEDGAPGQRRQPRRDNYDYINISGALKQKVSPHPDGVVVEDYSHIDSGHNNPQSRGTFEDDYNHIDNAPNPAGSSGSKVLTGRQPKAIDVYSVVNKVARLPHSPTPTTSTRTARRPHSPTPTTSTAWSTKTVRRPHSPTPTTSTRTARRPHSPTPTTSSAWSTRNRKLPASPLFGANQGSVMPAL